MKPNKETGGVFSTKSRKAKTVPEAAAVRIGETGGARKSTE